MLEYRIDSARHLARFTSLLRAQGVPFDMEKIDGDWIVTVALDGSWVADCEAIDALELAFENLGQLADESVMAALPSSNFAPSAGEPPVPEWSAPELSAPELSAPELSERELSEPGACPDGRSITAPLPDNSKSQATIDSANAPVFKDFGSR